MSLNGDYKIEFASDRSTNDKHVEIKPLGIYVQLPTPSKFWINIFNYFKTKKTMERSWSGIKKKTPLQIAKKVMIYPSVLVF